MPITDDASMQQMLYIYQQTRSHVPMIELYVEFEQQSGMSMVGDEINVDELGDIDWEEDNNDSEDKFEANYEVNDKNDDRDLVGNTAVQDEANAIVSQHLFGVPSFMRTLDLKAMHAPEFFEYANTEFATKRVEESFRRAGNIVVNRRVTKGRPKSTRYLNEMDSRDMRGPRRCTTCGRDGHSRSRCPQPAGPNSAGGH
ncbi:hypothetical protein Ahy_A03g014072 [Arachis hypogaea]|uniref:CCHC-type domain-containing protein n=1 Tax=Arachis hypogaea TaxID=3818 RepID=A0A445DWX2_ARAHY|nr:hypothetical protein Ahy_A03g014072 [Arachis hypogaea]